MHPLDTFLAEFTRSCAKLYHALIPWSLVVLVLAFPFEFARGVELRRLLMFLAKLFIIILLTARSNALINSGQLVVDRFIVTTGLVRPETLAQTYKDRLAATLGEPDLKDKSALRLMLSGHFLDALLYSFLLAVSYLALFIITLITFVEKVALALAWSVTPILFGLLAIEPLAHLGTAHIMRLGALCCWPIGFSIAATFSDALLNMAIHERLLTSGSAIGTLGAAVENLVIIAAVGLWDVISTLGAPIFIHRFLLGHAGPARLVPQTLATVGAMALPALSTTVAATVAAVKSAIQYFKNRNGGGDGGGPSGPGGPPPPPAPPPPPPSPGEPSLADPTGARKLENILNPK